MKPLDEKQKYTLAEVSDAIDKVAKEHLGSLAVISKEDLIDELQPKPKFAEGQVYAYTCGCNTVYRTGSTYGATNPRPLNLTELGPDVKALRDWLEYTVKHELPQNPISAKEALEAFDAKHGGDCR